MKQKKMILVFVITCMLNFAFLSSLSQAGSEYLFFNQYVYEGKKVKENAEIEWSFSGSNSYVGIIVMAMDEYNFNKFDNGDMSAYAYFLSDGNYIADYGTFKAKSDDVWYIVFWNFDAVIESTSLTYKVKFPGVSIGLIIGIVIGVIVVIAIIGGVVSSNKKKKATMMPAAAQPGVYQPYAPAQPTDQQSYAPAQPVVSAKVCSNCGASMEGSFCTSCGSKMLFDQNR
jgi:hypothetical protein